ncbi:hypothetical protein RFI_03574, partial [Reticulomyxa filosa]
EFNSFHVIWKDISNKTHNEPLNPYSITFKQGIQYIKDKLQMRSHFMLGADELIYFESEMNNSDLLLHDIYKDFPHYPIIQKQFTKKCSISRYVVLANKKRKFNPLLYECDLHKLKIIQDTVFVNVTRNNELQKLFHEVIKNEYLLDLITKRPSEHQGHIKKQINYNEKDENGEL